MKLRNSCPEYGTDRSFSCLVNSAVLKLPVNESSFLYCHGTFACVVRARQEQTRAIGNHALAERTEPHPQIYVRQIPASGSLCGAAQLCLRCDRGKHVTEDDPASFLNCLT